MINSQQNIVSIAVVSLRTFYILIRIAGSVFIIQNIKGI